MLAVGSPTQKTEEGTEMSRVQDKFHEHCLVIVKKIQSVNEEEAVVLVKGMWIGYFKAAHERDNSKKE